MSMTGELGGMRLSPGVYKSIAGYSITNILYLDGQNDPDAAWIFVMATTLTVNAGASVVMLNYDDTNGVSVWWSCADRADILVGASMQGTIMAHQNIAVGTGATTGPLMASLGEVTLLSNSVVAYPALQQQTPKPSRAPTRSPTTSKGKAPRVALSVDQVNQQHNIPTNSKSILF